MCVTARIYAHYLDGSDTRGFHDPHKQHNPCNPEVKGNELTYMHLRCAIYGKFGAATCMHCTNLLCYAET